MAFKVIPFLLIVHLSALLRAQDLNKGFFPVDHEELAGKSVSCIIKESLGFMWFGTSEGLCRFDGTNVRVYRHDSQDSTSLSHNEVNAIIEDDRHNLWIGTADGLNLYNREKDSFVNVDILGKSTTLSNHFITALASDKAGQIWIGTFGGGVNIFNTRTFQFTHRLSVSLSDNYAASAFIKSIVIHDDRAWIATRAGLKVLDIFTLDPALLPDYDGALIKATHGIKGQNGSLLFATADGEIKNLTFKKDRVVEKLYIGLRNITGAASYIHKLTQDDRGNLWIVTEKSGLIHVKAGTKEITQFVPQEGNPHSAPAYSLRTVYCDDMQRVWFGTYNEGVYLIDHRKKKFERYQRNPLEKESLLDDNVRAFAQDGQNNIWISGDGGINRLSMKTRQLTSAHIINRKLGSKVVKDIIVDSGNNLWIGTRDEGVVRVDLRTSGMTHFDLASNGTGNNKIVCLYEDKRKTIWAGTLGSGLFFLDKKTDRFISLCEEKKVDHVPDKSYVTSIIEDSDSTIWVGTLYGLFALRREPDGGYTYKAYYQNSPSANLSSSRIMVVYEDPLKTIWIGTFDNGLNKFIKDKETFEIYSELNGLTNNSIKGIISDPKGNLWISSNLGISKFDPHTMQSKNYTKADGLNSNIFNPNSCLQSKSGYFIFGGDNGFNIFHPDSIRDNSNRPVMYLTGLRINNKPALTNHPSSPLQKHISMTESLNLSFAQRSFAIDFVALTYGPPDKNQYCYKLEGFEETWNCVGAALTATYTNIDPGHYIFLVKGSNSDGVWASNPARLEITINPPLWKTWWAMLVYVAALSGVMYLILRIRTERLHIKNQLKLEILAREKEHELAQSKMHFFTNISHELRTPLSLILVPLEKVVTSSEIPAKTKKALSTAYRNCSKLVKLVNELMDLSKFDEIKPKACAQYGEVVRFITEIAAAFNDIAERKNIQMILLPSSPEIFGWYDSDKFEKILRNLLSNAFKFTHDHGVIRITIDVVEAEENKASPHRHLALTVSDNGIGIAPEDVPRIFDKFYQARSAFQISHSGTGIGLSLTKTLVDAHHGTIMVESVQGKGAKFTIRLPIDKKAFAGDEIQEEPGSVINNSADYSVASYEDTIIDQSLGKPELLIIEDNADLGEYLAAEFSLEFAVTRAVDGEEGFSIACLKVPDIIICDVVLPGKTGLSVCREIKADLRTSHIPVILLTARASTEDQVAGLECGADVYMPKPFSLRVLRAQVKQVVMARRKLYARFSQDAYLVPESLAHNAVDKEFIQKAVDYIDNNLLDAQLSVESLAEFFGISRSQVYRKIKALSGQTVVEFIRSIRLKHALKLMEQRKYTLSEIAYQTGFNSLSYFTRTFKDQYGKAPSEFIGVAKKT